MNLFRSIKLMLALLMVLAMSPGAFANEIRENTITVGQQTVRYLSAGTEGPVIVLLHGWPQNADEFRRIMPELARNHTVYAPDLSGVGGTTAPAQDWRKEVLARDVKSFVDALGLETPLLVGHDIGGMVAYAYARIYTGELSGVAVLDVPIPGLDPWDDVAGSSHAWHFDFHKQVDLAETLVVGQQTEYFRAFFNATAADPSEITDRDIEVYANAYGSREQLRAGFEFYRAFDDDAVFFQSQTGRFDLPMLVMGGEYSMQDTLPIMAASFATHGATNVRTVAIEGAGHWLAEEKPEATSAALIHFADEVFQR